MEFLYQKLAELEQTGKAAVLCTIIEAQGSTPRNVGSKMLVYPDGSFFGTVGGGELERRVFQEAQAALADGQARKLFYSMNDPQRGDPGVCGGQLEIFVEPIMPKATLIVVGGGHVGKAVVHLAAWLGFRVLVSDDRAAFCTPEAVPGAHEYLAVPMAQLPEQVEITPWTYLILTTRGADVDAEGLPALLNTDAAYIGAIGSRRRWETTKKLLLEEGLESAQIKRVHSPIGLELNAETPEEIAVSIMAEVIMLRQRGDGKPMSRRE